MPRFDALSGTIPEATPTKTKARKAKPEKPAPAAPLPENDLSRKVASLPAAMFAAMTGDPKTAGKVQTQFAQWCRSQTFIDWRAAWRHFEVAQKPGHGEEPSPADAGKSRHDAAISDAAPTPTERAAAAMRTLRHFMGRSQTRCVRDLLKGEEGEWFADKMIELAARIEAMPKTYEQDGNGRDAIAHLHYFKGGGDWYITEKDKVTPDEPGQHQAFGLCNIGYGFELGYVSIAELIAHGVELDFHFRPRPLREIDGQGSEPEPAPEPEPPAPTPDNVIPLSETRHDAANFAPAMETEAEAATGKVLRMPQPTALERACGLIDALRRR